jgi:GTP cyclohydrolase I
VADVREGAAGRELPDVVSRGYGAPSGTLDRVGMRGIALPLRFPGGDGSELDVLASADVHVDLARPEARGIHMSRLYRALDEDLAGQHPTGPRLAAVLQRCVQSQGGLSSRADLRLRFDLPLRRRALVSGLAGWRSYPIVIGANLGPEGFESELQVQVEYSSTCPGSAALARQLVRDAFEREFATRALDPAQVAAWLESDAGVPATPHAQRSIARLRLRLAPGMELDPAIWIDRVEAVLGTPVQTAVKREDEQEFARLNGANPMYCEDAARRIRTLLDASVEVSDYVLRVAHLESLHPHDAEAIVVRGGRGPAARIGT